MKYRMVEYLKDAMPGYVSGGEAARRFGVSRTAVWKYIEELRQEGYDIEASPRKGYRLLSSENRLNAYEIKQELNTSVVGREVYYFDTVDSTNNIARRLAAEGCIDGTAVIAGQQTEGKGRLGRQWISPSDKGIYLSVVLRPPLAPAETQILTLAAAVAVSAAIRTVTGLKAGIKWPNDLVLNGKKLCGILVEMNSEADRVNYLVIGIGINYSHEREDFPEELRDRTTSLKTAAGEESDNDIRKAPDFSKLDIVRAVLRQLDGIVQLVLTDNNKKILEMWRDSSVTLGREVSFRLKDVNYSGTAVEITEDGKLSVACSDGIVRELISGEVSVRGIYGYV